ncbi:peptidase M24, structural domain-containing protein [Syncephalis fuscata]|nr:peptidase M24, structural domain-containing protein [Syncephalis fuscata]
MANRGGAVLSCAFSRLHRQFIQVHSRRAYSVAINNVLARHSSNIRLVNGIMKLSDIANLRRMSTTKAGQPLPETHPHLMHVGEITPGITKEEYEDRRARLFAKLPVNSAVIIPGYRTRYASCNVFYPFRQSSDLFYLTGFNEPDAVAVLEKIGVHQHNPIERFRMFVRPRDEHAELWDGPRTGLEGARQIFGADEAIDSSLFALEFPKILAQFNSVYYDLPKDTNLFGDNVFRQRHKASAKQYPLASILHQMRQIKSPAEISLMQRAGDITGEAFRQVIRSTQPGMLERELDARMDFECRRRGAERQAYVPVVAGGRNALTMHYVQNDMLLRSGDLVLMDAGSEYHGYASDVTRTWPVNGKFTESQRQLYQAILNVQKVCIEMCTEENNISLNAIHRQSVMTLKEELAKLGWSPNIYDIENILYPHHVGHYLGLDVHDTFVMSRSVPLKAGTVVTIEPGIYVPDSQKYPEPYRGIGIRIEDDILVGQHSPIVLSERVPKQIDELEQILSEKDTFQDD